MMLIKLTVLADAPTALAAEAALLGQQDADEPPVPLAVSRFEAPGNRWQVDAYFPAEAAAAVAILADQMAVSDWQIDPVPDANWVAHVHATLKPVRAGRYFVHGPHDREQAKGEPFAIEIEASEAFGTAHHGSTVGCLRAIDQLVLPAGLLHGLDLGTGSGILAIALAQRAGEAHILATDIDARSVAIAEGNCRVNGVAKQVVCLCADGLNDPRLKTARFHVILANILAEPLIGLAAGLTAALRPGGHLILAGLLAEQAEAVAAAYTAQGCQPTASAAIEGWTTLQFTFPG